MAIESFVANLYSSTLAAVSGKFINNIQGGNGLLVSDLIGYDTGALTGISLTVDRSMTANGSGQASSTPTSDLSTAINTEGAFTPEMGSLGEVLFTFANIPVDVDTFSLRVFLATQFNGQSNTRINANGTELFGAGSTPGAEPDDTFTEFTGLSPNGSNELIVSLEDLDGSNGFQLFINGFEVYDIVEVSGVTGTVSEVLEDTTSVGTGTITMPVTGTVSEVLEDTTSAGTGTITMPVTGTVSEVLEDVISTATGSVGFSFVNDTFDGTAELGSHWTTFNGSVIDGGVSSVSGYLEGTVSDNTANRTRWFNTEQGRYDYQTVTVPFSGVNEYVAKGVGVGPVGDRLADLTGAGLPFSFCGLMVHDDNLSNVDYMFAVVGHRGSSSLATIETKGTIAGSSNPTDEGDDVFTGSGVTHGDLAVEVDSSGDCKFKYRDVGATDWIYTNSGTGSVPSAFSMGASGTSFKIGIIGYASDTPGVPFVFTVDSVELSATPTGTIDSDLEPVVSAATGIAGNSVVGSLSETTDPVVSTAEGLVISPITGTIAETLEPVTSLGFGLVPVDSFQGNEAMIAFFRAATGSDSYNFNELAIAYYKQAGSTALNSFNDSLKAAQDAVPFIGLSPIDWRNNL